MAFNSESLVSLNIILGAISGVGDTAFLKSTLLMSSVLFQANEATQVSWMSLLRLWQLQTTEMARFIPISKTLQCDKMLFLESVKWDESCFHSSLDLSSSILVFHMEENTYLVKATAFLRFLFTAKSNPNLSTVLNNVSHYYFAFSL